MAMSCSRSSGLTATSPENGRAGGILVHSPLRAPKGHKTKRSAALVSALKAQADIAGTFASIEVLLSGSCRIWGIVANGQHAVFDSHNPFPALSLRLSLFDGKV